MKGSLLYYSITASLAGFLFGFDTVVISGAEQTIQALWGLSDLQHGLAMSAALWGTVAGSLLGSWPTDRFGRRRTLLAIGALYFVSAIWSALAGDVYSFMVARLIGGLGVGVSTVAAPLYISEIAPPERRGRLAGLFQFNIVFGILVAFFSNAFLANVGDGAWRWMLGIEAVPALAYSLLCIGLPESPRWLLTYRGDREAAAETLARVRPDLAPDEIAAAIDRIAIAEPATIALPATVAEAAPPSDRFWSARMRRPIALAFLIAMFNQLSGINAVLYFAPRIFELTGMQDQAALLQSIGIGVTNLVFTFLGLWLIDRLGRRQLLVIGSLGYIASLGLCSWAFATETYRIVPACLFAFIAAHAVGQGAVIWVFISEIFPNRHRGRGQSLGSFTHWIFAALLTLLFPAMVDAFSPSAVFAFFAGMMAIQLVWALTMVPETKGRPLEEIERELGLIPQ